VKELKKSGADVKWVSAENLHLTLKFLGNVETGKIEGIVSALETVPRKMFEMEIGHLGVVPNMRQTKVIFADVISGRDGLENLAQAVDVAMDGLGFEPERHRFFPHLTLGRVRSPKNLQNLFLKMNEHNRRIFGKISVVGFCLVKSDIRPQGPIYTKIAEIRLKEGGVNG